jgi:hypothetical protein
MFKNERFSDVTFNMDKETIKVVILQNIFELCASEDSMNRLNNKSKFTTLHHSHSKK